MPLSLIVNSVFCGASDLKGTGLKHCKQDIKRVTTLGLVERGYKFQDGDIETLSGIRVLQQKGKLIVLQGVVSLTDNTAEDNIITREGSGKKVVAGKNPYEYTVMFDNGLNFQKALSALSSYKQYDIVMWDSKGDLIFTQTKSGEYKGFTLGMFENGKYGISNGADANMQSVSFQLDARSEFDDRVSWIVNENMDYFAEEDLDGYNDVSISIVTASPTTQAIVFDVTSVADNKKVAISGLALSDFRVTINGVNETLTGLTPDGAIAGRYTAATTSALAVNDVITIQTFDSVISATIIDVEGALYYSPLLTHTVAA